MRVRGLLHVLLGTTMIFVGLIGFSSVAAADSRYGHSCMNPSKVDSGYRAGVCADVYLRTSDHTIGAYGEAFCQRASGDYAIVRCVGINSGVDLYRRTPDTPWQQLMHFPTTGCGRNWPFPCPSGRATDLWMSDYPYYTSQCYFYYTRVRASIYLPGRGVLVSGITHNSAVYKTPACKV
jgi:hypothetical protein